MKALLDTNIIIHRENVKVTNYSIGQLFYWLDSLHYEKMLHPWSVNELRKYHDDQMQSLYDAKLSAYSLMHSIAPQSDYYKGLLAGLPHTENDEIDNQLLCEVYCGRVDILITEDRRMRAKAERLGISERVFSINSFITKASNENPALIDYQALSVRKDYFGNVDLHSSFFDTFRDAYDGFDEWFARKSNEEAYLCRDDEGDLLGFLYLKTEFEDENYADIIPPFDPKKRLKVGTFKVEASGFRLGERFIKIIFDNAIERKVDEIYVTLFTDKPELLALKDLFERWGFCRYGEKKNSKGNEIVLAKKLNCYCSDKSVQFNFPNLLYEHKKLFLPIEPQYHTRLLPDSVLKNEVDLIGEEPQRYALQKVYISFSFARNMQPGDFILLYRIGATPGRKGYESVITTLGVIQEAHYDFSSKEEFFKCCENRSVFSKDELETFWREKRSKLLVVKFIVVGSFNQKVTLQYLWNNGIISFPNGPRPFDSLTDNQFDSILRQAETEFYITRRTMQ